MRSISRIICSAIWVPILLASCRMTEPGPLHTSTEFPSHPPTSTVMPAPSKTSTIPPVSPTLTPPPASPTPQPATNTVCAEGCDFTSIQAAIDDPGTEDGAIIEITDPVHTEFGIVVDRNITLRGLGADQTFVQAHTNMEDAPDRVFHIPEGFTVTIRDMTIQHGNPYVDELYRSGGGIVNFGTLTLENCVITRNTANDGGGIYSRDGTLTINNCTISYNTADRIAPNGWDNGFGGGILLEQDGELILTNSTVNGNQAMSQGGGIYTAYLTTATITNSTLSGNVATTYGGGLYTNDEVFLVHATIVNNSAKAQRASGQIGERGPKKTQVGGGGVYFLSTLHIVNTIIANNGKGDCTVGGPDWFGIVGTLGTNSNNWIGDGSCETSYSGDPMLGELDDNGGSTTTHALLPGSPAIDAILAESCDLLRDQRGEPRPVSFDGQQPLCDIGAFELQPQLDE